MDKNSGIVFLSVMSQSLTCSVVRGESWFVIVLRNDIHLSALKATLNLEEELWWCLAWLTVGTGPPARLHSKINTTVYKEILKKHVVPILRTTINQQAVFIQDNALCHTVKSVKTFLFVEDVTVMWNGLLKAQTWILLKMFESYWKKHLRKRIQVTLKNYRLI